MGKSKNGQPEEERKINVPADVVERHPWLQRLKDNHRTRLEIHERAVRSNNRVKEPAGVLARRYLRQRGAEDALKAAIGATVEKFRDLWAWGLAKADGITVSPVVKLHLPYEKFIAELDAETAAKVIRHEPVLDVGELIRLADSDPNLQVIIGTHLYTDFSIEVKRVTAIAD